MKCERGAGKRVSSDWRGGWVLVALQARYCDPGTIALSIGSSATFSLVATKLSNVGCTIIYLPVSYSGDTQVLFDLFYIPNNHTLYILESTCFCSCVQIYMQNKFLAKQLDAGMVTFSFSKILPSCSLKRLYKFRLPSTIYETAYFPITRVVNQQFYFW